MKIYFVRHGESENFAANQQQGDTSPLSPKGIEQAESLAKRFINTPVDLIISSPHQRAKQTAEIINKNLNKELIIEDLLKENIKPTELDNKSSDDPEVVKIKKQLFEHFDDPEWRYSDEENFFDIKDRAEKALKYLVNLKKENVLVVSHGTIIRMIFVIMMFGKDFTRKEFSAVQEFFGMENTGISIAEQGGYRGWKMQTWNDTTHL
jgi:broad specificity phosphatase PhoE